MVSALSLGFSKRKVLFVIFKRLVIFTEWGAIYHTFWFILIHWKRRHKTAVTGHWEIQLASNDWIKNGCDLTSNHFQVSDTVMGRQLLRYERGIFFIFFCFCSSLFWSFCYGVSAILVIIVKTKQWCSRKKKKKGIGFSNRSLEWKKEHWFF